MGECADLLVGLLRGYGIPARLVPTAGYPVVLGEARADPAAPTLLVYGHYDVQPPEPLDAWTSPPFAAEERDGKLYARGATDDKGNLLATAQAVPVLRRALGDMPVNVTFLFEGEEEVGSPSLSGFVRANRAVLRADAMVAADRGIHESGRPQIWLGHKGMVSLDLTVRTCRRDVHSSYATLIPNAAWELGRVLGSLRDPPGRILVAGYYDDVDGASAEDRALLAQIPFALDAFRKEYGVVSALSGLTDADALVRFVFAPTCNIQGIWSGYTGLGGKTVLPAQASAKLDLRLVPSQRSTTAIERLRLHFASIGDVQLDWRVRQTLEPCKISPDALVARIARRIAAEAYGQPPVVWPLVNGSGPFYLFKEELGQDWAMLGLGAPFATANTHAPDENIGLAEYLKGIELMARFYAAFAENR